MNRTSKRSNIAYFLKFFDRIAVRLEHQMTDSEGCLSYDMVL